MCRRIEWVKARIGFDYVLPMDYVDRLGGLALM